MRKKKAYNFLWRWCQVGKCCTTLCNPMLSSPSSICDVGQNLWPSLFDSHIIQMFLQHDTRTQCIVVSVTIPHAAYSSLVPYQTCWAGRVVSALECRDDGPAFELPASQIFHWNDDHQFCYWMQVTISNTKPSD
jgi:hypothetical protein